MRLVTQFNSAFRLIIKIQADYFFNQTCELGLCNRHGVRAL